MGPSARPKLDQSLSNDELWGVIGHELNWMGKSFTVSRMSFIPAGCWVPLWALENSTSFAGSRNHNEAIANALHGEVKQACTYPPPAGTIASALTRIS
jgi:hypothetical protein